jgi:lysylphosphatidylglycerol synthetase-like protein (DUF2156 family)
MQRLGKLLFESAAMWGVPRSVASGIFWAPLFGGVALALARSNKEIYRFLLEEDGPIEWAQFLCFVVAAVVAAAVARELWQRGDRWLGYAGWVVALGLVFIAGEEIAWGQRIVGFTTPEAVLATNWQGEMTLHNMGHTTLDVINLFMALAAGWCASAYLLDRKLDFARTWGEVRFFLIPPLFLAGPFGYVFAWRLLRALVLTESGFTVTKHGEWAELCLAFAFCAMACLNWRRLRAGLEHRAQAASARPGRR